MVYDQCNVTQTRSLMDFCFFVCVCVWKNTLCRLNWFIASLEKWQNIRALFDTKIPIIYQLYIPCHSSIRKKLELAQLKTCECVVERWLARTRAAGWRSVLLPNTSVGKLCDNRHSQQLLQKLNYIDHDMHPTGDIRVRSNCTHSIHSIAWIVGNCDGMARQGARKASQRRWTTTGCRHLYGFEWM